MPSGDLPNNIMELIDTLRLCPLGDAPKILNCSPDEPIFADIPRIPLRKIIQWIFPYICSEKMYPTSFIKNWMLFQLEQERNNEAIGNLRRIKSIHTPPQRTAEWYQYRHNMITASNAWKALGSEKAINQLIVEKCIESVTPVSSVEISVNIHSPLHWGQKYEPLTAALYEYLYASKLSEFGCIPHPRYPFLGASPDGIVCRSETGRLGRLVEIKNVLSRIINGLPKKEYYVQCQLQMEVLDIDVCDFVETKFVEYLDRDDFLADSEVPIGRPSDRQHPTCKGVIVHFSHQQKPVYKYMPLSKTTLKSLNHWINSTISRHTSINYDFVRVIYWKLSIFSCMQIIRDRQWFDNNIEKFQHVWKCVEHDRIHGHTHRLPSSRIRVIKRETCECDNFDIN